MTPRLLGEVKKQVLIPNNNLIPLKKRRQGTNRTVYFYSGSKGDMDDLSREDLVKLVLEKDEALEKEQEEFKEMKNNFLRSYAEMENLMERTRREAENSKKFAVQVCFYLIKMVSISFPLIALLSSEYVLVAHVGSYCRVLQRVFWMLRIILAERLL